jgi:hypothetical protein
MVFFCLNAKTLTMNNPIIPEPKTPFGAIVVTLKEGEGFTLGDGATVVFKAHRTCGQISVLVLLDKTIRLNRFTRQNRSSDSPVDRLGG